MEATTCQVDTKFLACNTGDGTASGEERHLRCLAIFCISKKEG